LTAELAAILGRELSEMKAAVAGGSGGQSDLHRAWATALAVAWLELHAAEAAEQWRLIARKARKWIEDVDAVPPDRWAWHDAARRFLSA
jgi:hypothetical protein